MPLPLQVLFWIDAASLKSGRYRDTVQAYYDQFVLPPSYSGCPSGTWYDLPRPVAYIRLTDEEKSLFPEAVDFLYSRDVKVLAQDGTQIRERGCSDLFWLLDRPDFAQIPFTLYVRGDHTVTPVGQALRGVLLEGMQMLHANKDIVSVGFPTLLNIFASQRVTDQFDLAMGPPKPPLVLRTRDLWLATLLAANQPRDGVSPDGTEMAVLSAFSYHPGRHLAFNRSIATAL